MVLLQMMQWYNIIGIAISSALSGGAIVFVLKWARFKKMDDVSVDEKKAQVRRIDVDTEIAISTEAMKLVTTLRAQLDSLNSYYHNVQQELNNERKRNDEARDKIDELQELLDEKIRECNDLSVEVEQLRIKVEKYEREIKRRP